MADRNNNMKKSGAHDSVRTAPMQARAYNVTRRVHMHKTCARERTMPATSDKEILTHLLSGLAWHG